MSEIEEALKLHNETLALSNLNLDDVPKNVRPGKESQKRQATADLEDVRNQYAIHLRKALFGIAVTGPGTQDFVKVALEESESLVVNGAEMYERIVERVAPSMGDKQEFGVGQYSAVIQALREIGGQLNVTSMPSPKWTEPVAVGNRDGLLKHIRSMVESSVGLDLLALYISRQILTAALEAGSARNTVPVIVTGLDPGSAAALLTKTFPEGRNVSVDTNNEVNKEFVLDTFNKIKKQLKSLKKT